MLPFFSNLEYIIVKILLFLLFNHISVNTAWKPKQQINDNKSLALFQYQKETLRQDDDDKKPKQT